MTNYKPKYKFIYIKSIYPHKLWNDVEVIQVSWNQCRKIIKDERYSIIYKISSNIKYLKLNYPFEKINDLKKIIPIETQPILNDDLYAIELFMDENANPKLIFPND